MLLLMVTFSHSQKESFVTICALLISTFLQYWNTYFESLFRPSMRTFSQNMNG